MIRRRSYAEAVGGSAIDVSVETETPAECHTMSATYISSSDEECEKSAKNNTNNQSKPKNNDCSVRTDSVRYYDMRKSRSIGEDVASIHSVKEIYDACLRYVSDDSVQERKSVGGDFDGLRKIIRQNSQQCNVELHNVTELRITESDQIVITKPDEDAVDVADDNSDDTDDADDYDDDDKATGNRKSFIPLLYIGRNSARKTRKKPESFGKRSKKPKRVIFKNGDTNIPLRNNIIGKAGFFMKDFVTTMIECRWRWLIFFFSASNFFVWVTFALMFYVAALANGDLSDNPDTIPCIAEGKTFTGIYTFSVETQVSIGYGEKYPTEKCPEVIFIMLMEVIAGYLLIGVMVCIVFAKIIRPEKQLEGVGFSKNAVVCMRDGKLCLVVRAWDCSQKHSIGLQAKGWFVRHRTGGSPLILPISLGDSPLLLWPSTLQHIIDETSPMYDISAKDLIDRKFEIIITLTGGARLTGQMAQSRTSYMSHEILWGSRFKNIISYNAKKEAYIVDEKSVHSVESADIPLCSARLLNELNNALKDGPTSVSLPASPFFSPIGSPCWSFRSHNIESDFNKSVPF